MSHVLAAISAKQESHVGHYQLLNTLGQGSFAKVRWGRHILVGTEVAVKVRTALEYFGKPTA